MRVRAIVSRAAVVTLFVTALSCSDSSSTEPTDEDTGSDSADDAKIEVGTDVLVDSPPYPE